MCSSLPGDGTANHVISQSGSYYLSGNVNGVSGKAGIRIEAGDVTVNLNGFSLLGGSLSADGVSIVGSAKNVRVTNGSVRNWTVGIRTAASGNHAFDNLRFSTNRSAGLLTADTANVVTNCVASTNARRGFPDRRKLFGHQLRRVRQHRRWNHRRIGINRHALQCVEWRRQRNPCRRQMPRARERLPRQPNRRHFRRWHG